jgi:hypothetical protein
VNDWHREEWWDAVDEDAPVRRFAGGIEIVGDKEDNRPVAGDPEY